MSLRTSNPNESFVLIVDTSSSATSYWDEIRQTAEIIRDWTSSGQFQLFMLGNPAPISPITLTQSLPPDANQQIKPCSLIAPIMEALVQQEQRHSLIVVGSGEIFDLDDWIDEPCVDGWLLVKTGESLQGTAPRVLEVIPDQIPDPETLLGYFNSPKQEPDKSDRREYYQGAYRWQIDSSGYPLIFVDPLESFVHLFPVTKPQFEKFIARGKQHGFDDELYSALLKMNPRASYRRPDTQMIEQLLMTGITVQEAGLFSKWLGREYRLLSAEEWRICYKWFTEKPATSTPPNLHSQLARDARAIWEIIDAHCRDQRQHPKLHELSLMTRGILEWVVEQPGIYGGLGEPASDTYLRKACDPPAHPLGSEPRRLKDLGFRLRTR